MQKYKIGYFADGPWSHRALELLLKDNSISIKFIVPRNDTKDETLKEQALKNNIDYLHPVRINDSQAVNLLRRYKCDLFVSMSFNQIFRSEVINLPYDKTINCHAGKLPFYRGRNILNWALINDEKEFGITVHYVDEGIDTGDIILQENFPITDNDNYESLLNRSYIECARILYTAIKKIQFNEVKRIKQKSIHPTGSYCGRRIPGDEIINWNSSSRQIFNFIRAVSDPGPKAKTFLNTNEILINKATYIPEAPEYLNTPGQILAKSKTGFLIKTMDSFIEISEIDSKIKLKVGDRLG